MSNEMPAPEMSQTMTRGPEAPTQTLTVQVQDATARLEALKAQGDATEAHSRLDAVVGRVDGLTQTIGKRLDDHEGRLMVVESRGEGLEASAAEHGRRLAKLENWLDTVYSPQRDGWLTEISRLAARIEALEANAAEQEDAARRVGRPDLYAPPAGLKVDPNATMTIRDAPRGSWQELVNRQDAEIARLKAALATAEEEIKAYNQRWQKALADHAKAAQERDTARKQRDESLDYAERVATRNQTKALRETIAEQGAVIKRLRADLATAARLSEEIETLRTAQAKADRKECEDWRARYWREVEKREDAIKALSFPAGADPRTVFQTVSAILSAPDGTAQAAQPEPSAEVVALKEKVEGLERAASSARRLWEERRDTLQRRIDAAIVVTEGRDMFRPIVAILTGKVDVP